MILTLTQFSPVKTLFVKGVSPCLQEELLF